MQYFPNPGRELKSSSCLNQGNEVNYEDPSSFRPIGLLLTGKSTSIGRLQTIAEDINWLTDNQHEFWKGKSTVTALEVLSNQIPRGFYNRAYTNCVLLDTKGAFDSAWQPSIIYKLKEKNCPSYPINLIASFLKNRKASLKMFDCEYVTQIEQGCPQGSSFYNLPMGFDKPP